MCVHTPAVINDNPSPFRLTAALRSWLSSNSSSFLRPQTFFWSIPAPGSVGSSLCPFLLQSYFWARSLSFVLLASCTFPFFLGSSDLSFQNPGTLPHGHGSSQGPWSAYLCSLCYRGSSDRQSVQVNKVWAETNQHCFSTPYTLV
jgi:hypothetical protein